MVSYTFTFYFYGDSVQLKVWDSYRPIFDKYYPQTYTVQECLEDYCDEFGAYFVLHYIVDHDNIGQRGKFGFVTDGAMAIRSRVVSPA